MKKQPKRFDMYRKPNKPKWYLKIVEYIAAPIYMVFSNGRVKTDKEVIKMAKTFNSSKFQILTKIVIPANIGTFINSLKVNIGLSLVGVISGEFLVSKAGLRIFNSVWGPSF